LATTGNLKSVIKVIAHAELRALGRGGPTCCHAWSRLLSDPMFLNNDADANKEFIEAILDDYDYGTLVTATDGTRK
jgi:hypothetical protein